MFIKININPEGVGAFRISFEHDLPDDKEYRLLEELEDVIVSYSKFEGDEELFNASIEKSVEFLTANAWHMAESIQESYVEEEGKYIDTITE